MEKVPFRCENCSYKFESEASKVNELCPYCGKKGNIRAEITAQDLINEV